MHVYNDICTHYVLYLLRALQTIKEMSLELWKLQFNLSAEHETKARPLEVFITIRTEAYF